MRQLEMTATEKAEIMRNGLLLRELMRHEGWGVLAGLFKNAVERLDSVREITRRDGWFPLTRDNIALRAVASRVAMDGMNEWMESLLREVDMAVKLKEKIEKEKKFRRTGTTRKMHHDGGQ